MPLAVLEFLAFDPSVVLVQKVDAVDFTFAALLLCDSGIRRLLPDWVVAEGKPDFFYFGGIGIGH